MPGTTRVPKLCLHKATGQARVQIAGKTKYLGKHGTPEAEENYRRLVAEWLTSGQSPAALSVTTEPGVTVAELMLAYVRHVQERCGDRSKELYHIKATLRPLRRLYASLPINEFGPRRLLTLRQQFIEAGYCRNSVNDYVRRVRRMFRWAVVQEMVPPAMHQALQAVEGLRAGESSAREPRDVRPVPEEYINAVLPHVSRQVAAMIKLQLLCGARPIEITLIRPRDIDMTGSLWAYTPPHHKTQRFGKTRTIFFGPRAQDTLREFLTPDVNAYVFSPADADRERRERIHAERTTKPTRGELARHRRKRRAEPKRKPGEHYSTDSYRRAIWRGCDVADAIARGAAPPFICDHCEKTYGTVGMLRRHLNRQHGVVVDERPDYERVIPRWSPNRIRHSFATAIRKEHGIEAARILLGHSSAITTELYAERDARLVAGIVELVG